MIDLPVRTANDGTLPSPARKPQEGTIAAGGRPRTDVGPACDQIARRSHGAVGLLLSVACLGVFAWNAHWRDIGHALAGVALPHIGLAALWILFSLVARAWRWRVLLAPAHPTSFRHRLTATLIGFMGNNVFPGRLGEPLRCLVFSKLEPPVTFTAAVGTVVAERVFDVVATLAALGLFLALAPYRLAVYERESAFLGRIAVFGWVFAVGVLVALGVLLAVAHLSAARRAQVLGRVPLLPSAAARRLTGVVERFGDGLASLRSWRAVSLSLLLTTIVWCAILLNAHAVLRAFGFSDLGLFHALGVMVVLCFAVALPQAPGYIGVFQIASEKTLTGLYGVSTAEAQAFAIALWSSQVLPITVAGIVALWFEGFSVREVRNVRGQVPAPATP